MKKTVLGIVGLCALTIGYSQPAEAALFISISANAATASCDNGTAGGVALCTAAGFVTTLNSNNIAYGAGTVGGLATIGGYNFSGVSSVTANVPGSAVSASTDTKSVIEHISGAGDLTVNFAAYNFTAPAGPNLTLSASQTGNWVISAASDTSNFTGWGRSDNLPTIPGGTVAATPTCVPGGQGTTNACGTQSPDVAFTRLATPFALTGQEVIHQALGSVATYTASVNALNNPVPEPASMLLLGTGLLVLARRRTRRAA